VSKARRREGKELEKLLTAAWRKKGEEEKGGEVGK
jgi:hypothetical protein